MLAGRGLTELLPGCGALTSSSRPPLFIVFAPKALQIELQKPCPPLPHAFLTKQPRGAARGRGTPSCPTSGTILTALMGWVHSKSSFMFLLKVLLWLLHFSDLTALAHCT